MDRRSFIHPTSVYGTTVEGKVISLLNGFETVEDFDVIVDRPGFGYADEGVGYGIDHPTAQRILDARPPGGFTSISDFVGSRIPFQSNIPDFGADKFSDLVFSAIALSGGTDHRRINGRIRAIDQANPSLDPPVITRPYDVIVYGRFAGAANDFVFPVQLAESDDAGEWFFEHITNDYEQFALVAIWRDTGEIFHRSGLIPIQTYTAPVLEYPPIVVNQQFSLTDANFRTQVEAQAGITVDGDKTLESITSDFKDGFIEIKGKIVAPDTFLWFDSSVTFTSHLEYLPSRFAPDWVRDLDEILGIRSEVVEQNHSNAGFVIASIFAFLIPGVGPITGPIVTIVFLAIDAGEDSNVDTKTAIRDALQSQFNEQTLQTFANQVQTQIDNASPLTQLGLTLLSDFETPPENDLQAVIDFMVAHTTVETVTTVPASMTMNLWLTLPYTLS